MRLHGRGSPGTLRAVISPGDVVASVLPVYLLIVAGVVLRKTGIVRREHDEGLMRLVYTVMLPCFMLDKILGSTVLKSGSVVIGSVAIGLTRCWGKGALVWYILLTMNNCIVLWL